jgi:hypothetical protein
LVGRKLNSAITSLESKGHFDHEIYAPFRSLFSYGGCLSQPSIIESVFVSTFPHGWRDPLEITKFLAVDSERKQLYPFFKSFDRAHNDVDKILKNTIVASVVLQLPNV